MRISMSVLAIVAALSVSGGVAGAKNNPSHPVSNGNGNGNGSHGAHGGRHPGGGFHRTPCKKNCPKPNIKVLQP